MCGKKEISEDNGPKYATFPDKERCKKSECAFFEETPDGQNDRCRCKKMAGKLLTVRLKKNGSNDRLCPCWGDKSDRKEQKKKEERVSYDRGGYV